MVVSDNSHRTQMIQWYPGHMHKAAGEYKKILPQVDLVIEVIDARLPFSSENPMLAKLRRDKKCIKILNKCDLSDESRLTVWQEKLEEDPNIKTLTCSLSDPKIGPLIDLCRSLVPKRENRSSMTYAMIAGIPNVGKSTLINRLARRVIAKTGNEAALTRLQQRIEVNSELTLIDTPGMLWPNIENENSGYRLAATGAIRDTAFELQDVGAFIAEFFLTDYPQLIQQGFALESLPNTEIELLELIARKRGCIVSGGRIDLEKVSRLLIAALRHGKLGPVCFETPEMIEVEMQQVEVLREKKAAKKAARKDKYKQSR